MQDNYKMLLGTHRARYTKITELAGRKSGNYVLMAPVANKFGPTAAQSFQTAHLQPFNNIDNASIISLIDVDPNPQLRNATYKI